MIPNPLKAKRPPPLTAQAPLRWPHLEALTLRRANNTARNYLSMIMIKFKYPTADDFVRSRESMWGCYSGDTKQTGSRSSVSSTSLLARMIRYLACEKLKQAYGDNSLPGNWLKQDPYRCAKSL